MRHNASNQFPVPPWADRPGCQANGVTFSVNQRERGYPPGTPSGTGPEAELDWGESFQRRVPTRLKALLALICGVAGAGASISAGLPPFGIATCAVIAASVGAVAPRMMSNLFELGLKLVLAALTTAAFLGGIVFLSGGL